MIHRGDPERTAEFLRRQAEWTAPLRRHLYRKSGLRTRKSILDVGCGTGDITAEVAELSRGRVTGIDIEASLLKYASGHYPGADFMEADCSDLPFTDGSFDLVLCHFLLMWVPDPERAVSEMARVLTGGGVLVACAEPDYGGRVDYPSNEEFGPALEQALESSGADPRIGRKLGSMFRAAGLGVEVGVSATPWEGEVLIREFNARKDLLLGEMEASLGPERARRLIEEETARVEAGKMVMVPIFWAIGFKQQR